MSKSNLLKTTMDNIQNIQGTPENPNEKYRTPIENLRM
jgi:hypothetical protein